MWLLENAALDPLNTCVEMQQSLSLHRGTINGY